MTLTDEIKNVIAVHAKTVEPDDCIGVILRGKDGVETKTITNISAQARYHCFIEYDEIVKTCGDKEILAVYHSHRDGKDFSLEDKAVSEQIKTKLILYNSYNKSFKIYTPNGFIAPYIDRPWRQGIFTCVDLIIDYYKKELGIHICGWEMEELDVEPQDRNHFDNLKLKYFDLGVFHSKGHTDEIYRKYVLREANNQRYLKFFLKNGFKTVKDIKTHDVLLTKAGDETQQINYAAHGSIFLGDNKLLHHSYRRRSCVESFSNGFKCSLRYILRHESLL